MKLIMKNFLGSIFHMTPKTTGQNVPPTSLKTKIFFETFHVKMSSHAAWQVPKILTVIPSPQNLKYFDTSKIKIIPNSTQKILYYGLF